LGTRLWHGSDAVRVSGLNALAQRFKYLSILLHIPKRGGDEDTYLTPVCNGPLLFDFISHNYSLSPSAAGHGSCPPLNKVCRNPEVENRGKSNSGR
jgi:hypothetical protein